MNDFRVKNFDKILLLMKQAILVLFLFVSFCSLKSQNLDFGIQGGGNFYMGELNRTIFKDISYSFGGFVRLNINGYWAVKVNYLYSDLKGVGNIPTTIEQVSFNRGVHDLSFQGDFNFFKFSEEGIKNRITPYITCGLGAMFYTNNDQVSQTKLVLPFGIGGKFCLAKGLVVGVEWSWRKTFNADDLDGVTVMLGSNGTKSLYSDWYSYFGVNISYGIDVLTKKVCRTVWKKRPKPVYYF